MGGVPEALLNPPPAGRLDLFEGEIPPSAETALGAEPARKRA